MSFQSTLAPFSVLYGALSRLDRAWKKRGVRSFAVPIVSVGAITAGGSGKTPVTRELIDRLGKEHDIILLTRGYGRSTSQPVVWRAGESLPAPERVGDEPALLARSFKRGAIGIGPDRASLLSRILSPDSPSSISLNNPIVLLDDGFQHARLDRDIDIVIVDERTANERFLLPAGYLREKPSALMRADILLATSEKAFALAKRHARESAHLFSLRFHPGTATHWSTASTVPQSMRRVLLVSGIANQARFGESAQEAGFRVLEHLSFKDHHRYNEKDVDRILQRAHDLSADGVLTTEKDAVKLERYSTLGESLYVLPVAVEIPEIESLLDLIRTTAAKKYSQPESK